MLKSGNCFERQSFIALVNSPLWTERARFYNVESVLRASTELKKIELPSSNQQHASRYAILLLRLLEINPSDEVVAPALTAVGYPITLVLIAQYLCISLGQSRAQPLLKPLLYNNDDVEVVSASGAVETASVDQIVEWLLTRSKVLNVYVA